MLLECDHNLPRHGYGMGVWDCFHHCIANLDERFGTTLHVGAIVLVLIHENIKLRSRPDALGTTIPGLAIVIGRREDGVGVVENAHPGYDEETVSIPFYGSDETLE